MKDVLLFIFAAAIFIVALQVFKAPIRLALRILLNTVLGFIALILFDLVGSYIGVSLGVNLTNSIVIGVLGAPGFGLLLMARWLLIT
jgi:inhibitor of the pro-sigma K processing machinery